MAAVVLVEGESDRAALLTLAERRGVAVEVAVLGGATNVRRFLARYAQVPVTGLCDAGEESFFRRAWAGRDGEFFVCDADLEDELVRALGPAAVEEVIAAEGDLRSYRKLQAMPFHRDRPVPAQLHRFLGTTSGRKIRYARLLVGALDLRRVPRPLEAVLAAAQQLPPPPPSPQLPPPMSPTPPIPRPPA